MIENGIICYPQHTTNQNVPRGAFLVAEKTSMSGEITETYYVTKDGSIWRVGNWCTDKPHPGSMSMLCRATFDTEQMIESLWRQHFNLPH